MPITIKQNKVKFKHPTQQGFIEFNSIAEKSTDQLKEELRDTANEIKASWPEHSQELTTKVNELVKFQDTQPATSSATQIWVDTSDKVERIGIPTYEELSDLKSDFEKYVSMDSDSITVDWTTKGESGYPYGWCNGRIVEATGEWNSQNYYLRMRGYISGVKAIRIKAPEGYAVEAFVYRENDDTYLNKYIGKCDSRDEDATNELKIICEEGCLYRFTVGRFGNNNSTQYMTDGEFINQIVMELFDDFSEIETLTALTKDATMLNNNLLKYNTFNVVSACKNKVSRASNGITFSWVDDYTCALEGTAEGNATTVIFNSSSSFPTGVGPGTRLMINAEEAVQSGIGYRVAYYDTVGGSDINIKTDSTVSTNTAIVTVPSNATGLYLRLQIASGTVIPKGTTVKLIVIPGMFSSRQTYDYLMSNVFNLSSMVGSRLLTAEDDIFKLPTGMYHKTSGVAVANQPTTEGSKVLIFCRNSTSTKIAVVITSSANIYINCCDSSGTWLSRWRTLLNNFRELPDYYDDYMAQRIKNVNELENNISVNSDSFMFITDYHVKRNAGNSLEMIKKIVEDTGITKLFFGGDAYQTVQTTDTITDEQSKAYAREYVPRVYSSLQNSAPEFFSVYGNHEWNHLQSSSGENLQNSFELNLAGAYNYCLKRHESYVSEMTQYGNYYVDNKAKNIRYFFLQEDGEARPTNETLNWLGDQLLHVPENYFVVLTCHYAYRTGDTNYTSYSGRAAYLPKLISDILQAYNTKSTFSMNFSFTANGVTRTYNGSWDYSAASGNNVVAIFSGHIHHDDVLEKSNNNVLTIATTGDLYKNGSGVNMTFEDEEGNTIERTPGTIYEQAFDVVHIDLENRKVYMTRFGGGLDREFDF